MTSRSPGRRTSGLLAGVGLAAAAGLLIAALVGLPGQGRAPAFVADPDAMQPEVSVSGGVRRVRNRGAPERILLDSSGRGAHRRTRLLFLAGRSTHPTTDGAIAVDTLGRALHILEDLTVRAVRIDAGARRIESAVRDTAGRLWVVDASGGLTRFSPEGRVEDQRRTPFAFPTLAAGAMGVWAVRGPRRFDFGLPTPHAPLAVRLDAAAGTGASFGEALTPKHGLLQTLANAGHLATDADALYFAPFIRDEVVAIDPRGDTLWAATRGLLQSTAEPRFELAAGRPVIDYHPVNLGVALGLDGHLYVLSTSDSTLRASRLDVLDRHTGVLLRSTVLPTLMPTLAADRHGRVYAIDPALLAEGKSVTPRVAAPLLDLPLLTGGRVTSRDLEGKVVLINLWASWCEPCRREMPALDSLRRRIADTGFVFLAVSEDRDEEAARRFIREFGFRFPVAFGGGRMDRLFFYPGLPHTVLVDHSGRIARTRIGELAGEDLRSLEEAIHRELTTARVPRGNHPDHVAH